MSRFLRQPEVKARVGLSTMQIWRLEKQGKFPRRCKIGENSVGWLESEIDEFINTRVAARDAASPAPVPAAAGAAA